MKKIERIKELVKLLNRASGAYYNSGSTILTDEEFDVFLEELVALEADTGMVLSNSPTHNVGAKVLSAQSKVTHDIPMLSLDKLHTVEELAEWAGNDNCYLGLKLDGLSTRLVFENGVLVEASTRGDGETGSDILKHVKCYENVPTFISYKDKLIIDGESLILYDDFNRINSELPEDKQFANVRNLASGTLANLDTSITKSRHMKFIAWRVIDGFNYIENSNFFKLKEAENLGFEVVSMWTYVNNTDREHLSEMLHNLRKQANDKGIPIDGVVMAKDSIDLSQKMGRTAKFFRHSIAYKFEDDVYQTKLINIEFTMGKSGRLTPTAVFKSVIIDGTTVERASLTNLSIIKNLGLANNCTIFVKKANCIIPQITKCLQDGDSPIKIPKYCPVCGGETEVVTENASEVLMCKNPNCLGKLLGKLKFFVSKSAMDIEGLSEATLEFLIEQGWVKSFYDLYQLETAPGVVYRWKLTSGYGEKSVEKILDAIESSRDVKLENFICALSIDGVGKSASKTIADAFNGDFNAFYKAFKNHYNWAELADIGEKTSANITKYLTENEQEIVDLASEMRFVVPKKVEVKENPFSGKTLCVTGRLEHFSRDGINAKIAEIGAKAAGSVSKNCSYLITNEASGSSKYKKAMELNIPIITESEFIEMIGGSV